MTLLDWTKFEAFADNKLNTCITEMMISINNRAEIIVEKGESIS